MRITLPVVLIAAMAVAGCSHHRAEKSAPDSQANPLIPVQKDKARDSIFKKKDIPQTLVEQVTKITTAPYPDGIIVTVNGVASTQGAYDVDLIRDTSAEAGGNTRVYRLVARISAPVKAVRVTGGHTDVGTRALSDTVANRIMTQNEDKEKTVLIPTKGAQAVGDPSTRTVIAATRLSNKELQGLQHITVIAAANSMTVKP